MERNEYVIVVLTNSVLSRSDDQGDLLVNVVCLAGLLSHVAFYDKAQNSFVS